MRLAMAGLAAALAVAGFVSPLAATAAEAPGAPGLAGTWEDAGKTGIGTAYAPYAAGVPASRVWFSVANGYVTETMYGLIHAAQIKNARLAVMTADGLFVEGETPGATTRIAYLDTDSAGRPLSLAYRLVTRDPHGDVEIEKHVFTDPSRNVLFLRIIVRPLRGVVTPWLLVEPHLGDTSLDNAGTAGPASLDASGAGVAVTVRGARPFVRASVGFLGVSDGLTALRHTGALSPVWSSTGASRGSILLTAGLSRPVAKARTYDLAVGFGPTRRDSRRQAAATLQEGYARVLAHYNGQGGRVGWETWLASLDALPRLAAQSGDGGRLAYASALVLKAHEDKTHRGALIASLSNPWGDELPATRASTGYKAVWPRDFYECAMALAALGDRETPLAAFRYLKTVQVAAVAEDAPTAGGWFQQKSHVDGTPEWFRVQLDQTAMPIMLGWKLNRLGLMSDAELRAHYATMLKPAADFLVDGGRVRQGDNAAIIRPPATQLERWEEQPGYSPSTLAAEIAGLVLAADIAGRAGDPASAVRYRDAADRYEAALDARTFTTRGALGDGRYYLRINETEDANHPSQIAAHNGLSALSADRMVDAGFLELVRYGVRRADDPRIVSSLKVIDDPQRDDDLRVRYDIPFPQGVSPGFRRYGHDGYGEDTVTADGFLRNGVNAPHQRGRLWPLLTGERGHYELALAGRHGAPSAGQTDALRQTWVRGMERFANAGLMLPEQVYDGVGAPLHRGQAPGQGTDSATPLAWAHAEYVKLLRSLADGRVWDRYDLVADRYAPPASPPPGGGG